MRYLQLLNGFNHEIPKKDNMKRFILFFGIFISITAFAQERVLKSLIFHNCTISDRDFNFINEIPSSNGDPIGMFLLVEVDGNKYILVTLGKDPIYEFFVALSKEENDNGLRSEIYAGGTEFQGQTVPLQLFLMYTTSSIPDKIIVDVFNSPNYIILSNIVSSRH